MSRWHWTIGAWAWLVLYGCTGPTEPGGSDAIPDPPDSPFGLNAFLYRSMHDPARMDAVAALAAETGARWGREEFEWAYLETQRGLHDDAQIRAYDRAMATAAQIDLNVFGLLAYGNEWSSGTSAPSTPEHLRDFAAYVRFVVGRYGAQVRHWEIWNEPNADQFWPPQPDARAYFELLKTAHNAVAEVDPHARVIAFSSSGTDIDFIRQVFALGGGEYCDIVSVHPYSYPYGPEGFEASQIQDLRALMHRFGYDKPIWLTELGVPTHLGATGVSQQRQADLLVRGYLTFIAAGVELVCWYDLVDDGSDPYWYELNFGLANNDLNPKMAFEAYRFMVEQLADREYVGEIFTAANRAARSCAHLFAGDRRVLACWTFEEDVDAEGAVTDYAKSAQITVAGTVERVCDVAGNQLQGPVTDSSVSLQLTGSPRYLLGSFTVEDLAIAP